MSMPEKTRFDVLPYELLADEVAIAIPSSGRAGSVTTLDLLPLRWRALATLIVPMSQVGVYTGYHRSDRVVGVPDSVRGISATRQWLFDNADTRYVLQISDDITGFSMRQDPADWHLRPCSLGDTDDMLLQMCSLALGSGFAHVGLSARGGNNRKSGEVETCGRMCDVYLHDADTLSSLDVRWDRVPVMEDFDVTLQLLRYGRANAIITHYTWDQSSSNAAGGCSAYRTPALQEEGAKELERLHPGFVRAKEKPAKNWEGFGGSRWDVTVQWKKAYEAGKAGVLLANW